MYLDIKVDLRVCVCARASIPQGPLLFPAFFYERRGSERAADVEALTFMVAKAWARVKRYPPHRPSKQQPHVHTDTHSATLAAALMNRLMTEMIQAT